MTAEQETAVLEDQAVFLEGQTNAVKSRIDELKAKQEKRHIMAINHETVMESWRICKAANRVWKPWDLAEAVQNLEDEVHRERIEENKKAAHESAMVRAVAQKLDVNAEEEAFKAWREELTREQEDEIINRRHKALGITRDMRKPPRGMLLRTEFKEINIEHAKA